MRVFDSDEVPACIRFGRRTSMSLIQRKEQHAFDSERGPACSDSVDIAACIWFRGTASICTIQRRVHHAFDSNERVACI